MKNILVPVDFSDTSNNAIQYALELALLSNAKCTLVHAYKMPYDFASQLENRLVAIRKNAGEKLGKYIHQLQSNSRFNSLEIDFRVEEGSAEGVVTELAEEMRADLVVMGLSRNEKWDKFMSGNTGIEVIERSMTPVLFVPKEVIYRAPKEVVYAAEYREEDLQNLEELSQWAKLFNARLRVIHIEEKNTTDAKIRFRGFSEEVTDRLSYPYITQDLIMADDVEEGISGVAGKQKDFILAMAHYHKSFLKDIFGRSHTKAIAMQADFPLMVFFETEE